MYTSQIHMQLHKLYIYLIVSKGVCAHKLLVIAAESQLN